MAQIKEYEAGKHVIQWLSDCVVFITRETQANGKTEFTIEGAGAKDGRTIKVTLSGDVVSNTQQFKTALVHAFGSQNRFGKMNFEFLQSITAKVGTVKVVQRIEIPCWRGKEPMVPGMIDDDNIEFRLPSNVPAEVYNGDLESANDVLRSILSSCSYAPLVVTHVFSSPAMARWLPDERHALALWALTGQMKTTFAQICMTMYGTEYIRDVYLIKADTNTAVAIEIKLAHAGMLPAIYDDIKSVDPKSGTKYVAIIHIVVEGTDKGRGTKDAKLKEALTYFTSPIITGEVRPEDASTTARVFNLTWVKPDVGLITQIQEDIDLMPVIGYNWLKFLAGTSEDLSDSFAEDRRLKETEFAKAGYKNSGRLASIYTVMKLNWALMLKSPFRDVFEEFQDEFTAALDDAIKRQGDIVNNDTEASKFMGALVSIAASQPQLIQQIDNYDYGQKIIGKQYDDGMFILPELALAEMERLKVFTQKPTIDSMTQALAARGELLKNSRLRAWKAQRTINQQRVYGWFFINLKPERILRGIEAAKFENQQQAA